MTIDRRVPSDATSRALFLAPFPYASTPSPSPAPLDPLSECPVYLETRSAAAYLRHVLLTIASLTSSDVTDPPWQRMEFPPPFHAGDSV